MDKGKVIGRIALDAVIFWLVFIWRGGVISDHFQTGGALLTDGLSVTWGRFWTWFRSFGVIVLEALLDAWKFFVFVSPFGRAIVSNPDFRYSLIWCTVFVVLGGVLLMCMIVSASDLHAVWNVLISLAITFALWYACFGMCHLIVLIPVWYGVLAAAVSVLFTCLIFFIAIFIYETYF